jgi:hypothetical protein
MRISKLAHNKILKQLLMFALLKDRLNINRNTVLHIKIAPLLHEVLSATGISKRSELNQPNHF